MFNHLTIATPPYRHLDANCCLNVARAGDICYSWVSHTGGDCGCHVRNGGWWIR